MMDLQEVKFETKEDAQKGYYILLTSGTVVTGSEQWVYYVPKHSIEQLKKAKVSYVVSSNGNSNHKNGR